ncbi:hypothetical protein [Halorussus sp. AFM4]|uniref:hypothetical protein n=1 Tax=Halorussus sp. AFM4 TaxID=3421651 RepID=UPI003EBA0591
MYRPPLDPRDSPLVDQPTWRSVAASYLLAAAIPIVLWIATRPIAGLVTVAAVAGLIVGARRAYRLRRCFRDCRGFAFDLGGRARITVSRIPADEPN